jgi:hypothetical protein
MIPTETITDALAADLRESFLAAAPLGAFEGSRALLSVENGELPCPRLVFTCGDARRVQGMDNTARIPFSIDYTTSIDRTIPEQHRTAAGLLSAWIIGLKTRRRALLSTRLYLHDIYTLQPLAARPTNEREATTTFRGEAVVTLAEVVIA